MVLLAWPVAFHAIRADKKGMAALGPASSVIEDINKHGKRDMQEPFPPTRALQLEETFKFCISQRN